MKTKSSPRMGLFAIVLAVMSLVPAVTAHAIDKSLDDILGQLPRLDYPGARAQIPTLLVLAFTAMLAMVLLVLLLRGPGWVFWPFVGFGAFAVSWLFGVWFPLLFLVGIPVLGVVRKRVVVRDRNVQVTYYAPPAETYVHQTHYVEERVTQPVVNVFLVHNAHHPQSLPEMPPLPLIRDTRPGYLVVPEDDEEELR